MNRIARALLPVLVATGSILLAPPVNAQIRVALLDDPTGNPVPLAAIQTLNENGDVIQTESSGPDGSALLQNLPSVRSIRVTALGYHTREVPFEGNRGLGVRPVEIRLVPSAIALDSITVEVEGGVIPGRIDFTRRRAEHSGIFLDPVDVGIKAKYGVVHVFAELDGIRRTGWGGARLMPTIVSNMGTGCLQYRLNNRRVKNGSWNAWPLSSLLPQDVLAVEIYRHFGEVPEPLRKDAFPPDAYRPCGLVVIWTKEAW